MHKCIYVHNKSRVRQNWLLSTNRAQHEIAIDNKLIYVARHFKNFALKVRFNQNFAKKIQRIADE